MHAICRIAHFRTSGKPLAPCALQHADHEVNQSKQALTAGASAALTDAGATGSADPAEEAVTASAPAAGSESAADRFVDDLAAAAAVPKGKAKAKGKAKGKAKALPKGKAKATAVAAPSPPPHMPKPKAKAKVGFMFYDRWYKLGCSKCRWSMKGCATCRNPAYNGRRNH